MSKTILAEIEGWTPVMDVIVREVGLITAAVFGAVWRHCQMRDGVCTASQSTLADKIGLRRETINKHLSLLVEGGYLEAIKTDGITITYRDTGKANLLLKLTGGVIKTNRGCDLNSQVPVIKTNTNKTPLRDYEDTLSGGENVSKIYKTYHENIGQITKAVSDKISIAVQDYPAVWITEAISIAALNNARNWNYIEAILKRWQEHGKDNGKKPSKQDSHEEQNKRVLAILEKEKHERINSY